MKLVEPPRPPSGHSAGAWLVGLGATLCVLWPRLSEDARDSFPLSTYPMFSRSRGDLTLYSALGIRHAGAAQPVSPALVGSTEVLQAKALIQRAALGGPATTSRLCREIAARCARRGDAAIERISIVRRVYDPIEYFTRGPRPQSERTLHSCEVPGRPASKAP